MAIDILGMYCVIFKALVLCEGVLEPYGEVVLLALCEEEHLHIQLLNIVRICLSLSLNIECLDVHVWAHYGYFPLFVIRREFFRVIKLDWLELILYSFSNILQEVLCELALNRLTSHGRSHVW